MKLNRKGMTLIEIIVSVGLISIVIVFLFRLLVDVRQEEALSNYSSKDAINRTEIIESIQTDIKDKSLTDIVIHNTSSASTVELSFSGTKKTLEINPTTFHYNGKKWTIQNKTATYDLCKIKSDVVADNSGAYFYVRLTIPVKMGAAYTSPALQDIEITYLAKKWTNFDKNRLQKYTSTCS